MGSKASRVSLLLVVGILMMPYEMWAGNIDPANDGSKYAYGENIGWISFKPSQGLGVAVTGTGVTGYAWGENIGWINFSPTDYGGVVNDGIGNLSGYAWGENVGWINFAPIGGGVFIDACGDFNGMAWSENIGWISFRSDGANPFFLRTSWVSPVDKVAPVTDPASPILDWYKNNVQITLASTDCGTGTKEVHYILDGGTPVILTDSTAVVSVLTEGEHTLSFYSVDQAGNIEPPNQVTIRVDETPPNINIITPANLVTYNINQGLAVNYSVTDNLSGVKSITSTIPYGQAIDTSKVGTYSFTVSATDNAGNAGTVTNNFSIAYPGNIDPNNAAYQYARAENVGWINFKPSWGPGVTVSDTAVTGKAWGENIGWINLSPTDYGGVVNDGVGNLSGYAWGENVGWINFAPTGGGVFIDACGDFNGMAWGENIGWISFRSDGANPFYLRTSWVSPVDTIPPVTGLTSPILDWYKNNVQITLAATDCGIGTKEVHYILDGDAPVLLTGSTAVVSILTEGEHTLSFYSVDQAGNIESPNQVTIRVDETPPDINIVTPANQVTYNINQSLVVNYSVTDNLSGVQSITSTIPYGQAIDTSKVGTYSFTVSATDNAGNTSTVTNNFSIAYPGNIDPNNNGSQYAWGENVGWINLKPSWGPGITVTDTGLTGYAWGENIGWINLNPSSGGVLNDGAGNLSGYAWGENIGWISFSCQNTNTCGAANYGVFIDPTAGVFSGYAWGENIGWINFGPTGRAAVSSWRGPVSVTVQTLPVGLSITVDGTSYTSPQTFQWAPGNPHTIATTSPQGSSGTRYVFNNWSDGGAISHSVTVPASPAIYTATFDTQYQLTTSVSPSGMGSISANPTSSDGYYGSGTPVQLTATANFGYLFANWSGDLTGTTSPQSLSMSAPKSVTANFNYTVTYTFEGFFSPVDNLPIVNIANAGQTIPVKWRLTDSNGVPISDPVSFQSFTSYNVHCNTLSGDPESLVEEYVAGSSGLQYLDNGNWQFNWKTSKTYARQCRTMVLILSDGSSHEADFKFK